MTMDVAAEFVLAGQGSGSLAADQLVSRFHRIGSHELYIAVDGDGREHLLVRASAGMREDRRSSGLQIWIREIAAPSSASGHDQYLDLVCLDGSLDRVFELLVGDVVALLEIADQKRSADSIVRHAVAEWRYLFAAERRRLSREALLGLYGELKVLAELSSVDPVLALEGWVGPAGAVRDFEYGATAVEVKTTGNPMRDAIHVSSVEQMDPPPNLVLYLAVVDVEPSPHGECVDDVVERLVKAGTPRLDLASRLAGVGYSLGSGEAEDERFLMRGARIWRVHRGFPSLRRVDLGAAQGAVQNINYDLVLGQCGVPEAMTLGSLAQEVWGK